MIAPSGSVLAPGTYNFDYDGPVTAAYFNFSGDGRSCSDGTTASYTIHEIALAGDSVQRLRASFTVHCDGAPKITGDIVLLADPWR
jgi:hypothetical protein